MRVDAILDRAERGRARLGHDGGHPYLIYARGSDIVRAFSQDLDASAGISKDRVHNRSLGSELVDSAAYQSETHHTIDRIAPGWPDVLEVGPGWYPLLARLNEQLAAIAPIQVLQQCKPKFGALCFYAEPSDEPWSYDADFNEAIRAAEWKIVETYEECGAAGARQYVFNLWVSTLCAERIAAISQRSTKAPLSRIVASPEST